MKYVIRSTHTHTNTHNNTHKHTHTHKQTKPDIYNYTAFTENVQTIYNNNTLTETENRNEMLALKSLLFNLFALIFIINIRSDLIVMMHDTD